MIGCDDSRFNRGKVLSLEVFGLAGKFGGVECYKVTKRAKMLRGVCYEGDFEEVRKHAGWRGKL